MIMAAGPSSSLRSTPIIVIFLLLLPRNSIITGAFSIHPRPTPARYPVDLSVASNTNDKDKNNNSPNDNDSKDVNNLRHAYAQARNIRTLQGHDAGIHHYQDILRQNPGDRTAGTRLAASAETPQRQEQACFGGKSYNSTKDLLSQKADIQRLRALLGEHSYNHESVARCLGVPTSPHPLSCHGPLFASPVAPGSVTTSNYPLSHGTVSGLSCLMALFLLSLVVPRTWIVEHFGEANCTLLQDFGWIYPCSVDPLLMIPYVNVFPLDFDNNNNNNNNKSERLSLYLVTDLHPRVLSTTTVGESSDPTGNAVMYIGPDSLALSQHFTPYAHLMDKMDTTGPDASAPGVVQGLDFGTGSGVQALSALMHWKIASKNKVLDSDTNAKELKMTAIDINPRALRFTQFNAILNGLEAHVSLVQADLVSGNLLVDESTYSHESLEQYLQVKSPYALILANPPFLPVPSDTRMVGSSFEKSALRDDGDTSATTDSIAQRYGLFSSGGGDGEVLLQRVVELASRYLSPGGFLGVVSEFFEQEHDPGFERFSAWWSQQPHEYSNAVMADRKSDDDSILGDKGVLFVNEFPIDVATYSARRADNPREEMVWNCHLESLNITSASPGMLYIQKGDDVESSRERVKLLVSCVPKTEMGSVWTPSNFNAIRFTQGVSHDTFGWP